VLGVLRPAAPPLLPDPPAAAAVAGPLTPTARRAHGTPLTPRWRMRLPQLHPTQAGSGFLVWSFGCRLSGLGAGGEAAHSLWGAPTPSLRLVLWRSNLGSGSPGEVGCRKRWQ